MDLIQWVITTVIGILGILIGRSWQRHDKKTQKDKEIIDEIIVTLSNTIIYCREKDFGSTFNWSNLSGIDKYREISKRSNFFFLDKDLEKLRNQLFNSLNEFRMELALHSFVVNPQTGLARIPQEHENNVYSDPKEYFILAKQLNELADNMCNIYDDLVKLARRKL